MIIYLTNKTQKVYGAPNIDELPPDIRMISEAVIERESGDRLLEWGGKLFYFDGRKCIQLVNFASKLTLFLT